MGEAPCSVVAPRRSPARFRLPRHGLRRKVHVVRLGNGGARAGGARGLCGLRRRIKLRWFRSAMWRLAELCVTVLSGPPGTPDAPPPWTGVEPCFAAPFLPAALVRRAGQD
ncbi:uncharacterized protein LOC123430337 [Hordeum vulgare subsp. vulgare]|uniref:uncharacterized protein LOC123430337 n=1 Tax=Hordeum vulgare subsp. vulgare TaxID=112509 RepID=UPI001B849F85|nr:uncharacterized protein LOC123430337 [Hordeum vulgare subsp. vulgare]KAI5015012.1 hypothetical protein ZWY2020_056402 [Hordeum vulgare]